MFATPPPDCVARAEGALVLHVDNFTSVQAALDAAAASARAHAANTALLFALREYRLGSSGTAGSSVLSVSNVANLRIDGCGATVVVTTPVAGFLRVTNATRLLVSNLTIDYEPLPMTQGRVVAVRSPLRYSLKIDNGFPMLSNPYFVASGAYRAERWALVKDRAAPTRHKEGTLNLHVVANWTDRGGGVFDVTLCSPLELSRTCTSRLGAGAVPPPLESRDDAVVPPEVGDPIVHLARYYESPTFGLSLCGECAFEGVSIHASPGASFVAEGSSALVVRDATVAPAPGRYHSTNADGVFVLDARVGPTVHGSRLVAIGDDGIIVKTRSGVCTRQVGESYTLSGIGLPRPGDVMRVWTPTATSGLPAASATVLSAAGPASAPTVSFAEPLDGIACDATSLWANDNLTGPGFRIADSTIASRRFGVLCMARDGVIEHNAFVDNPAAAVLLINDDDYDDPKEARMGWMPRNVTIVHNAFVNNSRCATDPWHTGTAPSLLGVVATAVVGPHAGQPAPFRRLTYRGVRRVTVADNRFDGWFRGLAISVGNAASAAVRDNTIANPPTSSSGVPLGAAVAVCEADGVAIDGNALVGRWSSVAAAVSVDARSTSRVEVHRNTLRPQSASQ
mmetsp:Transcript_40925/g.133674  ORF Transcript_40925/g.133674 Transcript_40925/m.133674 type:complete len:623 (+) Transcript_40925:3-1871(+)